MERESMKHTAEDKGALQQRCWAWTQRLVALDTSEHGVGLEPCVALLQGTLIEAGFKVELVEAAGAPPMIVASREARGGGVGRAMLYNHYDVDEPGDDWRTDPFALVVGDGRWAGLGVGDNKGALGARLAALPLLAERSPELVWVIQGQEESGSVLARRWFGSLASGHFDVWLEENGWTDPDGTQRVLAAVGGPERTHAAPSERQRERLLAALGRGDRRVEGRLMNKAFVPGGCPFQHALPPGSLYVGLGTNDAQTRIHAPNESIAADASARHALDFVSLLIAVARGELA